MSWNLMRHRGEKVAAIVVLLLVLLPALASAQVAYLRSAKAGGSASNTITVTSPDLTGANAITACIGWYDGSSVNINAVEQNGVALTAVQTGDYSIGYKSALYQLVNPTAGNLVVTFSGSALVDVIVLMWSGVDTGSPISGSNKGSGSGSDPSVTVTGGATDEIATGCVHSNVTMTVGSGSTLRDSSNLGQGITYASTKPGASSVTLDWTGGDRWSETALILNAAAAASGGNAGSLSSMGVGR